MTEALTEPVQPRPLNSSRFRVSTSSRFETIVRGSVSSPFLEYVIPERHGFVQLLHLAKAVIEPKLMGKPEPISRERQAREIRSQGHPVARGYACPSPQQPS